MSAACSAILLCAVIALFGLGAAGAWPAPDGRRRDRLRPITAACAAVCALALIFLLAAAIGGAEAPSRLFALGGLGHMVALDGLNLPPLVVVFAAGLATLAFGWGSPAAADRATRRLLAPLTAASALALMAADVVTLMVGLVAATAALWAVAGQRDDAAAGLLVALLGALACLLLAFDLWVGPGSGLSFAALRALPPSGWRAGLVLLATLAGVAIQIARVPMLRLPPLAAALSGAIFPAMLVYLLMRVLLDLAGPAQPLAWGVPMVALGIGVGLFGAARAILAADLSGTLAAATAAQAGLSLIGVGLAAMARAADQPDLAAFALAGTLVQVFAHGAFKSLLGLGVAGVRAGAGTEAYVSLGGISRGMPVTTACMLAGAVSLAALPVSAGFIGVWTLLQALFAAARLGGMAIQLLMLAAALVVGLIAALLAHAALRLVGIGLLGRPRTPRTAAATEAPRAARTVLIVLTAVTLAAGFWPAALFGLAAPAVRALTGTRLGLAETWLAITPPLDASGTMPLAVAALFGGLGMIFWFSRRGLGSPARRLVPGWADGYAPPPPWLPFGDPALQIDPTSFSAGMAGAFVQAGSGLAAAIEAAAPSALRPTARLAHWRAVLRRYQVALALAALLALLLALAVIEAA